MTRIFICYRRSDSMEFTERIADRLTRVFGKESIFMDVDAIPPGANFATILQAELRKSNVVLVIIGTKWADSTDTLGYKRLSNPDDFVRIEIEAALNLPSVLIIPVLVGNANIPSADELPESIQQLLKFQMTRVRSNPDFHNDLDNLIGFIKETNKNTANKRNRILIPLIGGMIFIIFLASLYLNQQVISPFPTSSLTATFTFFPTLSPTAVVSIQNTLTQDNIKATQNIQSTAIQIVLALTATESALHPTVTQFIEPTSGIIVPSGNFLSSWQIVPSFMAGLLIASALGGFYFWQSNRKHLLAKPVIDSVGIKDGQISPKPSVFISYKRVPSSMLAVLLGKSLEYEQIDTFVDVYQQDGAGSFPEHLYEEISKREIFVCLLSNETLKSDWVLKEIRYAYDNKKTMIPVLQESFKDWLPKKGVNSYSAFLEKLKTEGYPIECIQSLVSNKGVHFYDQDNQFIDHAINQLTAMIKETHKKHHLN